MRVAVIKSNGHIDKKVERINQFVTEIMMQYPPVLEEK